MNTIAKTLISKGWQSSRLGESLKNDITVYTRKTGIKSGSNLKVKLTVQALNKLNKDEKVSKTNFYVFTSKERFKHSLKQILLWPVGMTSTTHSFTEMILK